MAIDFWLKDESLEGTDNLRDPDVIAQEIVEDLWDTKTVIPCSKAMESGL